MNTALIIGLVIIAAAAIIGIVYFYSRKRTEALQATAASLGLSFSRKPETSLLPGLRQFHLFSQGHSKKAVNVMSGSASGVEIAVFDYRYTVGGGQSSHTKRQTVILLNSDLLNLSHFVLRPENLFHKIGKMLGYQDINFDSHPQFSNQYLLRSRDEDACRSIFTGDILDYFSRNPGLCAEGGGGMFIFYRSGKAVRPENIQTFLQQGIHILSLFQAGKSTEL